LTLNTGNVTNDVEFDEVSTTDNHDTFFREYPGFTYLHVTSGTTFEPITGTLYTRVGSVGATATSPFVITNGWHEQPWTFTNDFVIRPSIDYYTGNKQILSTPFMFYFGLRVGKTGVDKFIKLFGDKGAFTTAE
jgi:hypothetical protein